MAAPTIALAKFYLLLSYQKLWQLASAKWVARLQGAGGTG